MRVWVTLAMVATAFLSGCAESDSTEGTQDLPDVDVTDTTGSISGVVVSSTVMPIPGARVTVLGLGQMTTSDEQGLFSFQNLDPGTYFLNATADGFLGIQTSADIQEGEVTKVKMQLQPDERPQPYWETIPLSGFMMVGDFYGTYLLNILLGNSLICECEFTVEPAPNATAFVLEMLWEDSLGDANHEFYIEWDGNQGGGFAEFRPSPFYQVENAATYQGSTEFVWRVSSDIRPDVDQQFDIYITPFYNTLPPEGWGITNGDA